MIESIPMNHFDHVKRQIAEESYRAITSCRGPDGGDEIVTAVNSGVGSGLIEVTTRGRLEFTTYFVYLDKIRRESAGMVEATQARRAAWKEMAKAVIHDFGVARTPPAIVHCLANVRARWFKE